MGNIQSTFLFLRNLSYGFSGYRQPLLINDLVKLPTFLDWESLASSLIVEIGENISTIDQYHDAPFIFEVVDINTIKESPDTRWFVDNLLIPTFVLCRYSNFPGIVSLYLSKKRLLCICCCLKW
jgi:hypothetical protein